MAVFRWGQAFDAFRDLEREMDRLLAGVPLAFQGVRLGRHYPAVNLYELTDGLLLTAELPGTRPEDLEITVADGTLFLKGRRSGPENIPDERFRRQERPRGMWQRSIALPERVEEAGLSAEFTNGVLKIRLPRAAASTPRQIPISDGSQQMTAPHVIGSPPAGETDLSRSAETKETT